MSRDDVHAIDPRRATIVIAWVLVALILGGGAAVWFAVQRRAERKAVERSAFVVGLADDGEQVQPVEVDLSKITIAGAEQLAGRPVFVDYDLFDNDDRRGDWIAYGNDGPAGRRGGV